MYCFDVTAILSWGWLKLRLIEVEVDWSWGWLKLRLIEVEVNWSEVDWSWGWLKLRLIEVKVDYSWGWLKLRLIEAKVNLYYKLWNVYEVYSYRLITFILYNFFPFYIIFWGLFKLNWDTLWLLWGQIKFFSFNHID